MNVAGRVRASFDAQLFRSAQGRWANFNSNTREYKVQLLQNEGGYLLNCKQDGQVSFGGRNFISFANLFTLGDIPV